MIARCRPCARAGKKKCGCWRRQSLKVHAHLSAVRMKGAHAAGAKKHREAVERWVALAKGLTTLQFAQLVYRRGYHNGYVIGERRGRGEGYRQGFDDGGRQARYERAMGRSA